MDVTFEDLATFSGAARLAQSSPTQLVLKGSQARTATSLGADALNVRSILSFDEFAVDAPMPALRSLLVTGGVMGGKVTGDLRLAPELECFFADDTRDLRTLPSGVRELGLHGAAAPTLPQLPELRRLHVFGLVDAAAFLGSGELRSLRMSPTKNVAKLLRTLSRLEELALEFDLSSVARLGLLGEKPALRDCYLAYSGLKSLEGVEGWRALERLTLFRAGISSLEPLAESTVRTLVFESSPQAKPVDFAPIGRMRNLESLRIDVSGPVASFAFLEGSGALTELMLGETPLGRGALAPLVGLSGLQRLATDVSNGAEADWFREKRPDVLVETFRGQRSARPAPVDQIGIVEILGSEGDWSIFQDLSAAFGDVSNHEVEKIVRKRLKKAGTDGIEFDSEAGNFACYAAERTRIETVAEAINELANR